MKEPVVMKAISWFIMQNYTPHDSIQHTSTQAHNQTKFHMHPEWIGPMNRGDNYNSVFSMCGKRAEENKLPVKEIVTEKEIARKP